MFARRLLLAPVHAVLWVWLGPWWLRTAAVVAVGLTAAAGGYYLGVHRPERQRRDAISHAWHAFDASAAVGHEPTALAALDDVLTHDPGNPRALARKAAIAAGDADPDDPGIGVLTIRGNLRLNRLAEAEREAGKRLAHEPHDWVAHCARATAAFARGDRAAGVAFVDRFPPPDHPRTRPDAGGLLTAFRLYREAGRDPTPLRVFVRNIFLADLGGPADLAGPPAFQLQRVECYAEAFDADPDKPPADGLAAKWAPAAAVADRAADGALAAGDVAVLAGVGRVGGRLAGALTSLRRANQITADQFAALRSELDDRGAKVWSAVIEKEPANPDAYHGLAVIRWRAGDYPAARETVTKGLAACRDDPPLYALFATMLRAEDRPQDAAAVVWKAAERNPDGVVWWVMAAEASAAARRRDLAITACERGLKASPKNPWLVRTEAGLRLDAGDPHRALELLGTLGEPAVLADPATARMYARSLAASGLGVLVDGFLAKAETPTTEEGSKVGTPKVAAAAFRGVLDASPSAARADAVADRAGKLLARWADHPDLLRVRADALAVAAETSDPAWQPVRVAAAVKAFELVRAKGFADLDSAAGLARVRLKGDRRADLALLDLAPVRAAEPTQPVSADALETLGAAYLAAGQPAAAVRTLEKVRRTGHATAGGLATLALAYHASGDRPAAAAAFAAATELPLTPRDRPDYLTAARVLRQEKP